MSTRSGRRALRAHDAAVYTQLVAESREDRGEKPRLVKAAKKKAEKARKAADKAAEKARRATK